jgi:hypothetical protein
MGNYLCTFSVLRDKPEGNYLPFPVPRFLPVENYLPFSVLRDEPEGNLFPFPVLRLTRKKLSIFYCPRRLARRNFLPFPGLTD